MNWRVRNYTGRIPGSNWSMQGYILTWWWLFPHMPEFGGKLYAFLMLESVHSGSVSWDNCIQAFSDELHVSLFPWYIPTPCLDSIVHPFLFCWVKGGVCMFRCYLPPGLLTEWQGSLMCHCGKMVMEWTPNESQHRKLTDNDSQHRKLTLKKKILLLHLLGVKPATFRSQVKAHRQNLW